MQTRDHLNDAVATWTLVHSSPAGPAGEDTVASAPHTDEDRGAKNGAGSLVVQRGYSRVSVRVEVC